MFLHAEKKIKLLSAHETIAVFEGLEFRTCRGRTARCPKNCGDSGEFAKFRIVEYLRYEKNGKYGDNEQQQRLLQVSDFFKSPKVIQNVQSVVKTLKKRRSGSSRLESQLRYRKRKVLPCPNYDKAQKKQRQTDSFVLYL